MSRSRVSSLLIWYIKVVVICNYFLVSLHECKLAWEHEDQQLEVKVV